MRQAKTTRLPHNSTVSVHKIMKRLFIFLILFWVSAIANAEEYFLFKENLVNSLKTDNFVKCTDEELAEYGVTGERCIQVKAHAQNFCAKLVGDEEPNRLTHLEWKKRMGYFWHCRIMVSSGCKYSFELTDLIKSVNSATNGKGNPSEVSKLENMLECNGFGSNMQ